MASPILSFSLHSACSGPINPSSPAQLMPSASGNLPDSTLPQLNFLSHSPLQISIWFPEYISCPAVYASNMCPHSFSFVSLSALCIEIPSRICQMNESCNWEISAVPLTMQLISTVPLTFLSRHSPTSLWGGGPCAVLQWFVQSAHQELCIISSLIFHSSPVRQALSLFYKRGKPESQSWGARPKITWLGSSRAGMIQAEIFLTPMPVLFLSLCCLSKVKRVPLLENKYLFAVAPDRWWVIWQSWGNLPLQIVLWMTRQAAGRPFRFLSRLENS